MEAKRKVEVLPYQEGWALKYFEEAEQIKAILEKELISIHHIGSTSIIGMSAKPIIDILVEVKEIAKVDDYNKMMESLDYSSKGENGIKGRRYFQKGGMDRTHHIHIYGTGNQEINRHLNFRDFLIENQEQAKAYANLKEKLAIAYPYDIESYIKGKDAFIKTVDLAAQMWKNGSLDKARDASINSCML